MTEKRAGLFRIITSRDITSQMVIIITTSLYDLVEVMFIISTHIYQSTHDQIVTVENILLQQLQTSSQ